MFVTYSLKNYWTHFDENVINCFLKISGKCRVPIGYSYKSLNPFKNIPIAVSNMTGRLSVSVELFHRARYTAGNL